MLLSLNYNGYRFFNESVLSFNADARIKRLLSNSMEKDGKNVLKTLGIYGANNSGKTNIYNLFRLLKNVLNGKNIMFNNSCFNDPINTNIEMIFNNNNDYGWMKYSFSYNNEKKQYEYENLSLITYYAKGGSLEKKIYEKNNLNKILDIFDEDKSRYLDVIPSKLPFLYSIEIEGGEFGSLKPYLLELQKFADSIELIEMYNIPIDNTIETMKSSDSKKKRFIQEFVKNADISINNFEYDDKVQISIEPFVIKEKALHLFNNSIDTFKLMTTYNEAKVPSFFYDSTGTKKIESIASYIYDAIKMGKILVVDELDNGLHFKLTRAIISIFNNLLNDKSQLVFITHDLLLINSNILMRKDQIYFVNRNIKSADLLCLKDFTVESGGPREVEDIMKHYNRGEFGKVPNPNFIDLLVGVLNE